MNTSHNSHPGEPSRKKANTLKANNKDSLQDRTVRVTKKNDVSTRNRKITKQRDVYNIAIFREIVRILEHHKVKCPEQWKGVNIVDTAKKIAKVRRFVSYLKMCDRIGNKGLIIPFFNALKDPRIQRKVYKDKIYYIIGLDNIEDSILISKCISKTSTIVKEETAKRYKSVIQELKLQVDTSKEKEEGFIKREEDFRKQNGILASKLSNRNLNPIQASEKHSKLASDFAEGIYPIVSEIRSKGYSKLYEIAEQLNIMGLKTRTGSAWTSTAVMRLERRQQEHAEEV